MIIDTERLDNFIKSHKCQIDSKAKNFEDALIYVNYKTGKWESVYEQLKKDMELEEKWDELNNASFLKAYEYFKDTEHSGDTELILANDWQEYKAGTSQYEIWADMFDKYSGGSKLAEHPIYDDSEKSKLKIPDIIKDLFLDSRIIIELNSELEYQVFLENFKNNLSTALNSMPYNQKYKYYFSNAGSSSFARYSTTFDSDLYAKFTIDFTDIYKIAQVKKIPDIIIDMFLNKETAIRVNNESEHDMLFLKLIHCDKLKLKDEDYQKLYFKYDKKRPFYYIRNGKSTKEIYTDNSMVMLTKFSGINQLVGFKDFDNISKVTEPEKDNDIDLEER